MRKLVLLTICLLLAISATAQKPSPVTLAAPTPTATAPSPTALPVGTVVKMKLDRSISTSKNLPDDVFSGRVTQSVVIDGRTIVPIGAGLQGRFIRISEPRRIRGTPTISLRPDLIIMPDGKEYAISAVIVDTDQPSYADVDDEGRIKGQGHDGGDLKEGAAGAAVGGASDWRRTAGAARCSARP